MTSVDDFFSKKKSSKSWTKRRSFLTYRRISLSLIRNPGIRVILQTIPKDSHLIIFYFCSFCSKRDLNSSSSDDCIMRDKKDCQKILGIKEFSSTVKPVLSGHSKRRPKLIFKTDYRLMQVKSIAECSKGSILQYFRPSLSYHLSLKSLFCLFLSGRLRQVLLYFAEVSACKCAPVLFHPITISEILVDSLSDSKFFFFACW